VHLLAWRHTNLTLSSTGMRKKRLLVVQWIHEDTVEPAQLRVWEEEVKRSPYISSAYINAGKHDQELGAGCSASIQQNTETVKLQGAEGPGCESTTQSEGPAMDSCILHFLAWRPADLTNPPTGRKKKLLLVVRWIDEETVQPAQLILWEKEVKRSPYVGSAFSNAGLHHQELMITGVGYCHNCDPMHQKTETVKLEVVHVAGNACQPSSNHGPDPSLK
jgi:hypothetical protein